jgi:hypothetical protein
VTGFGDESTRKMVLIYLPARACLRSNVTAAIGAHSLVRYVVGVTVKIKLQLLSATSRFVGIVVRVVVMVVEFIVVVVVVVLTGRRARGRDMRRCGLGCFNPLWLERAYTLRTEAGFI